MQLPIKRLLMLGLLACLLLAGCRSTPHEPSNVRPRETPSPEYQRTVERIRNIVGKQLDLNASEVDIALPLSEQKKGADELDVIEIIMMVEEEFNVGIRDDEVGRDLSVRKLADIVSKKRP